MASVNISVALGDATSYAATKSEAEKKTHYPSHTSHAAIHYTKSIVLTIVACYTNWKCWPDCWITLLLLFKQVRTRLLRENSIWPSNLLLLVQRLLIHWLLLVIHLLILFENVFYLKNFELTN